MQPIQGSNIPKPAIMLKADTLQITSSWGARTIKIEDTEGHVHSLKGSELIDALGVTIKNSKSPEQIKRAKTILSQIKAKNLKAGKSNPLIRMLNALGISNHYSKLDTKLQEKAKGIQILRDDHLNEMGKLQNELETVNGELDIAQARINSEKQRKDDYNIGEEQNDGASYDETEASMLGEEKRKLETKIKAKQKILDSFPEIEKFKGEEPKVRKAAFEKYDKLYNIKDQEMRLLGAEVAAKIAKGDEPSLGEENKLTFLETLNNIPKDLTIEKQFDEGLVAKKQAYIDNLGDESPLKPLLENEALKKLAEEVDSFMYGNPSMQDLALFIGVTVPEKIREGVFSDAEAVGAEDMADPIVALMLLQKNTSLPSSISALDKYIIDNPDISFGAIEASLMPHFTASGTLDRLSKIQSRLDEISIQLKSHSTIKLMDEDNPLNIEFEKLKEEMRQLGSNK